jgi:hypothetical protein
MNIDIESMMRNSKSAADIMDLLQQEVDKVARKLEAEKKRECELDTRRENVLCAVDEYFKALGILPKEALSTVGMDERKNALIQIERELFKTKNMFTELDNWCTSSKKNLKNKENFSDNPEKIIKDYIHNIL